MTLRDFFVGSTIINLPLCYMDVCIGAGAKHVDHNSPGMVVAFVAVVLAFLGLVAFIGVRAKKKLERFEEEDKKQLEQRQEQEQEAQEQQGGDQEEEQLRRSTRKPRSNSMTRYEETAPASGGRGGRGEQKLNDLLTSLEDGDDEAEPAAAGEPLSAAAPDKHMSAMSLALRDAEREHAEARQRAAEAVRGQQKTEIN